MREPVSRADEAAIEDTCRFLEGYMPWKADPDGLAGDNRAAIEEVGASNLPDWAKGSAILALLEQREKRRGRPKQGYRDMAIQLAAMRLVVRGYMPTRNDATFDRASASSIIHEALQRLGEMGPSEKSINAIIADSCRDALKHPDFFRDVLK
jgi:hypothetical protein